MRQQVKTFTHIQTQDWYDIMTLRSCNNMYIYMNVVNVNINKTTMKKHAAAHTGFKTQH